MWPKYSRPPIISIHIIHPNCNHYSLLPHIMPSTPLVSKFFHSLLFHSKSPFHKPYSAMSAPPYASKSRLRGVVFDMDGTLTVPAIDFPAMYKAVLGEAEYQRIRSQHPSGIDILHHIEDWTPDEQRRAYAIIVDFERQGLERLQIMPGAVELCRFLDSKNIRRGLITRNFKEAVDLFHQRFGFMFSPALSREFRPCKPHPAPLLNICSSWELQPSEIIMVGDSLKDDITCGKRAGAFTCLLDEKGRYDSAELAKLEFKPDFKVSSLAEIVTLLETNFVLEE